MPTLTEAAQEVRAAEDAAEGAASGDLAVARVRAKDAKRELKRLKKSKANKIAASQDLQATRIEEEAKCSAEELPVPQDSQDTTILDETQCSDDKVAFTRGDKRVPTTPPPPGGWAEVEVVLEEILQASA